MNNKKYLSRLAAIILIGLLMIIIPVISAKADTAYLTDSSGANIISGNKYKIMFGWAATSSRNAYLTGQNFYSSSNENNAGYFQVIRADQQVGFPIQQGTGFIIRDMSTGQYWKYHSNMVSVNVSLDYSIIPYSHTETTSDGSTFFVSGNRQYKNNDGYNYVLSTGAYTLGYDWNDRIGDVNFYETELFFIS